MGFHAVGSAGGRCSAGVACPSAAADRVPGVLSVAMGATVGTAAWGKPHGCEGKKPVLLCGSDDSRAPRQGAQLGG